MTLDSVIRVVLVAGVLASASCGKSSDKKDNASGQHAATLATAADAPMKDALDAAGFRPIYFRRFPAQVPGMKANVVVYRAKSGSDGGVLYLQEYGDEHRVVWHWYFEKDAPDSVASMEINNDGLWDVRMYVRGEARDWVQDQSFTFVAPQRDDRVAMNGTSSEPVDANSMVWKCFDGDSTTAWRSAVGGAFIDIPAPLGIVDGILRVQLLATDQPAKCRLKVDGKAVQEFDLETTVSPQLIHLEPAAKQGRSLRLEIDSGRDAAAEVAISELGLR